jgi:hypothetical protein
MCLGSVGLVPGLSPESVYSTFRSPCDSLDWLQISPAESAVAPGLAHSEPARQSDDHHGKSCRLTDT